jgi:hypothetical protein
MAGMPREAREGLMRAWLDILRERHPEVMWIPAETVEQEREREAEVASADPVLVI